MYLVMDTTGAAFSLTLDGAPLYDASSAGQQSSATVTLPPGGGESLALEISSGGVMNIFPPLIRLTGDPTYQADAMSYANYYAIPAGAMALTLVLLCGLFLLGVSEGRPRWKELLLIFAAAELTVYPLAVGFGTYFFPAALLGVLAWRGWALLCVLALAAYLALHRSRGFWLAWALMAGCSLAALLACWGVSALAGGYLARFMSMLLQEIGSGYYENLVYWLTSWLVLACTVLSAWELVRYIRFHVKAAGGFMAVLCENTFDGRVDTDARGAPRTRKSGDEPHGFGLTQMRAVAEKYGSILDVSWTDTLFTVQTALKLPEKK